MLGLWRSCERDTGSYSLEDLPYPTLFPVVHQGKSLGEGVPRSPPQASHRTGSSDSRLLQLPICGPEGFRRVAPHHRPVYPEHVHRISALPYGDSSVCPTFHWIFRTFTFRFQSTRNRVGIFASPWEESHTSSGYCASG